MTEISTQTVANALYMLYDKKKFFTPGPGCCSFLLFSTYKMAALMSSSSLCWEQPGETARPVHLPLVDLHLLGLRDETAGLLVHWLPLHSKI